MIFVAYLPEILALLIFAGGAALIIWYLKAFYADRAERQKKAEEHQNRHGGECVLEWSGSFADGAADTEFGRLVVEIPKKSGNGAALFYEKGLVLGNKRLPYGEIKDVLYAASTPDKKYTLKQAVRDMAVLWIYPKKGATIGIRELNYQFDNETMENIKKGLGF
ncbi:MAG: hypothetical protein HDR11_07010 [Lachnospiraceae bacterium]|nr:hypothetical protein [Lachnospiraceae bacterium]